MRGEKARARVSWWPTAAAVGVYLGLAVVCYWGAWSTDPARNSLAGGDQFQNTWYLAWTPFALLHGHNPFLSSYLNYPYGLNTLTNTGIILLGVLASPVTLLFGATAAFNTMLTLALAASATSGYVLARRLTGWRPAAFVGGLVYGFSPYEIAEGTGHLHLSFAPLPPLILLALYEIVVARTAHRVRWAVALGLLVTAQFFVSSEILVDTAIVCAIALVILAVAGHRRLRSHLARVLPPFALAGSIAAVLLAYPVWFALKGPARISGPVQLAPQGYRADLLAPLVPDSLQRIAPHGLAAIADHFSSNISENGSYLGITLLLTLAVGVVVLWRLPVVRMLATLGAAAFVISLGASPVLKVAPPGIVTGFPLPERLFTKIRLLSNIIPGRFSLFVALFAALLLAVVLDELHGRGGPRRRGAHSPHATVSGGAPRGTWLAPLVVAAVALVPLVPAVPYAGVETAVTVPFFSTGADRMIPPDTPVLLYPYADGSGDAAPVVWQASTFLRFKMSGSDALVAGPSGQIAFSPDLGFDRVTVISSLMVDLGLGRPPAPTAARRAAVLAQMRSWDIHTVVAIPGAGADSAAATHYLVWLFGRPDRVRLGTLVWFHA